MTENLLAYPTSPLRSDPNVRLRGPGATELSLRWAAGKIVTGTNVYVRQTVTQQALEAALLRLKKSSSVVLSETIDSVVTPAVDVLFGGRTFAATLGLWLVWVDRPGANLLSHFISTEGLQFTPAEFVDMRDRLLEAARRHKRRPTVDSVLEALNTGFFLHRSLAESEAFINDQLITLLRQGEQLHADYLRLTNTYQRRAHFAYRSELKEHADSLAKFSVACGALRSSGRRLPKHLAESWTAYLAVHPDCPAKPATSLAALREQLTVAEDHLDGLRRSATRTLREASLALSSRTAEARFGDPADFQGLAHQLRTLIERVNEVGLYQLPVGGGEAVTTARQLQQLVKLLEQLRATRHHLTGFAEFYEQRHFWYAQPAHLRRILAALREVPVEQWEAAFSAWYFERCLEQYGGIEVEPETTPDDPPPATRGRLVVVARGRRYAATARDLWLMDADEEPPEAFPGTVVTCCPLHDQTAVHVALAGHRRSALSLLQHFNPINPPNWWQEYSETPFDRLRWAFDDGDYALLTDWVNGKGEVLRLQIPGRLTLADAELLLRYWESMVLAAPQVRIFHRHTSDKITQGLLTDGFSAEFLVAALLRAAEAASVDPFDRAALVAIGEEIRLRVLIVPTTAHPLAVELARHLRPRLPRHFFEVHQPWRDTFLPLVVLSPQGKKTVLLPEGRLPGYADPQTDAKRLAELHSAGLRSRALHAGAIWEDYEAELDKLVAELGGTPVE